MWLFTLMTNKLTAASDNRQTASSRFLLICRQIMKTIIIRISYMFKLKSNRIRIDIPFKTRMVNEILMRKGKRSTLFRLEDGRENL